MFNDRYGLTEAVIGGRKTQTRRIVPQSVIEKYSMMEDARYDVGEIVAVAQSYIDCGNMPDTELDGDGYPVIPERSGFYNKMFVRADLMPYKIRITGVRVERLQDISDWDCLAEGIHEADRDFPWYWYERKGKRVIFNEQRKVYASLMDKVCGKGTWERNPFVWVYDFELVK